MLKNLENIKSKFKAANIVEQLIIINILIFIISFLIKGIASLMLKNDQVFFDWFALSASGSDLLTKPWTIFTYGFLHGDFFHILYRSPVFKFLFKKRPLNLLFFGNYLWRDDLSVKLFLFPCVKIVKFVFGRCFCRSYCGLGGLSYKNS